MAADDASLNDRFVTRALNELRLSAHETAEVLTLLQRLEKDLVALLGAETLTELRKADLERLLKQARERIARYAAEAQGKLNIAELAKVVAGYTAADVAAVVQMGVALPTDTVLKKLVGNLLIQGAPSGEWWAKQEGNLAFRFAAEVRQGIVAGETNAQIVQRIRGARGVGGIMEVSRRDAMSLVRTSVQTVANEARLATFRANADVIKGVRQLSTLDGRTSDVCIAYSGGEWDLDGKPINGTKLPFNGGPPRHFSCFPGDTLVSARCRITSVSKRWFDGEVVVIKTASGRILTATPNHPILTDRGWVAAGVVDVGGHVIADALGEGRAFIDGDGQDVPACIHDVAEAFACARGVSAVPMEFAPEDFHGDGADGQVGVIWADGFLCCDGEATTAQHGGQYDLITRGAAGLIGLPCSGYATLLLEGLDPSSGGAVSGGSEGFPFLRGGARHARELLLASIARGDSGLPEKPRDDRIGCSQGFGDALDANALVEQPDSILQSNVIPAGSTARAHFDAPVTQTAVDCRPSDAELADQIISGFSGPVFADEVVSVDRQPFHDFVYNLETDEGWYIANGLVVHNCRSILVPITKTFRELGLDMDEIAPTTRASERGPVAADTTFEAYMKRRGPAFVEQLLGKGRADLYLKGKITLRDLVDGRGRPLTLAQLQAH